MNLDTTNRSSVVIAFRHPIGEGLERTSDTTNSSVSSRRLSQGGIRMNVDIINGPQ